VKGAVAAEGFRESRFAKYGKFLTNAVQIQREEWNALRISGGSDELIRRRQKAALLERLLYRDNRMAFVLLWSLLEPERFDRQTGAFHQWSIPCLEMEVDHVGMFRFLSSGEIFYEGGETKGSNTGTQIFFKATTLIALAFAEGRKQLERRFVLIDAILHLGFGKKGTYSARVFVPRLDSQQTSKIERRRLCFTRTDIPETPLFAGKELLLLPSGKLAVTSNPDPFNRREEKERDKSLQIYKEYGDYIVRLEAPSSSDEDFE